MVPNPGRFVYVESIDSWIRSHNPEIRGQPMIQEFDPVFAAIFSKQPSRQIAHAKRYAAYRKERQTTQPRFGPPTRGLPCDRYSRSTGLSCP